MNGLLSEDDLENHQPLWVETLQQNYRDYDLFEHRPNGQGLAVLIACGILQQFSVANFAVASADSLHLQIEAMKLAFADVQAYLADPNFMRIKPVQFLDKKYLQQRVKLIDMQRAKFSSHGIPSRKRHRVFNCSRCVWHDGFFYPI